MSATGFKGKKVLVLDIKIRNQILVSNRRAIKNSFSHDDLRQCFPPGHSYEKNIIDNTNKRYAIVLWMRLVNIYSHKGEVHFCNKIINKLLEISKRIPIPQENMREQDWGYPFANVWLSYTRVPLQLRVKKVMGVLLLLRSYSISVVKQNRKA